MDLWKSILLSGLQNENTVFDLNDDNTFKEIINSQCYKILQSIINVVNDDNLSDEKCFYKIEKILSTLENYNIFTDRHDFG